MFATYVDHMGDDLRVVNAARVSFNKESKWDISHAQGEDPEFILSQPDERLINYLAKHGHWTPFAQVSVQIVEKVPIFVARQRFKHMVGFVYNEVSRRYVDDTPEFYEPKEWRKRPDGSVKQGSGDGTVEIIDWGHNGFTQVKSEIKWEYIDLIHQVTQLYNAMIENGVAPEQARMVLPQSMYTEYYVTGSLAAWARAYKQRIDSHAQKEIQTLAQEWDKIISPLFPVSWKALTSNE